MQYLAVKATVTGTTDLGEFAPARSRRRSESGSWWAGSSLCTTTTIPP